MSGQICANHCKKLKECVYWSKCWYEVNKRENEQERAVVTYHTLKTVMQQQRFLLPQSLHYSIKPFAFVLYCIFKAHLGSFGFYKLILIWVTDMNINGGHVSLSYHFLSDLLQTCLTSQISRRWPALTKPSWRKQKLRRKIRCRQKKVRFGTLSFEEPTPKWTPDNTFFLLFSSHRTGETGGLVMKVSRHTSMHCTFHIAFFFTSFRCLIWPKSHCDWTTKKKCRRPYSPLFSVPTYSSFCKPHHWYSDEVCRYGRGWRGGAGLRGRGEEFEWHVTETRSCNISWLTCSNALKSCSVFFLYVDVLECTIFVL